MKFSNIKKAIMDGKAFTNELSCSHTRVHKLINFDFNDPKYNASKCFPVAFKCSDYDAYKSGKCHYDCTDDNCQIMSLGLQHFDHDFPKIVPFDGKKLYVK